jgi:serine carboxypeptidase-like clade II
MLRVWNTLLTLGLVAAQHPDLVTELPGVDLSASATNGSAHFSGYLDVQAAATTAATRTFYYYVQHPDPTKPLLVWMNGGPGASSLMGFFTELGPLLLNSRSLPESNDGAWRPLSNPYAWSTEASLLVWEQPAGVGFSRCAVPGPPCPIWNDTSSAAANLQVLRAFYGAHPAERSRDLVISGESYAGVYVPLLAQQVHEHNAAAAAAAAAASAASGNDGGDADDADDAGDAPIPLKGIMVGNGCVGYGVAGGCGLDSLDLLVTVLEQGAPGVSRGALAAVRAACAGELVAGKLPSQLSARCLPAMNGVLEEIAEYNQYSWGSPCGPDGSGNWGDGAGFSCGADEALQRYLSGTATQRALHVLPPSATQPLPWQAWDGDSPLYVITAPSVLPAYAALLRAGYGVTIYNGLRDTAVPAQGALRWIESGAVGNATVVSARRKWSAVSAGHGSSDAQVAGYVTRYASGIQFATIIGAGHLTPAERPASSIALVRAVLRGEELPRYKGPACKRLWLGRGYGTFCGANSTAQPA